METILSPRLSQGTTAPLDSEKSRQQCHDSWERVLTQTSSLSSFSKVLRKPFSMHLSTFLRRFNPRYSCHGRALNGFPRLIHWSDLIQGSRKLCQYHRFEVANLKAYDHLEHIVDGGTDWGFCNLLKKFGGKAVLKDKCFSESPPHLTLGWSVYFHSHASDLFPPTPEPPGSEEIDLWRSRAQLVAETQV